VLRPCDLTANIAFAIASCLDWTHRNVKPHKATPSPSATRARPSRLYSVGQCSKGQHRTYTLITIRLRWLTAFPPNVSSSASPSSAYSSARAVSLKPPAVPLAAAMPTRCVSSLINHEHPSCQTASSFSSIHTDSSNSIQSA
jgi:hypothetical protein